MGGILLTVPKAVNANDVDGQRQTGRAIDPVPYPTRVRCTRAMSRLPSPAGAAGYARDFAAVALPAAVFAALVVLGRAEFGLDQTAAAEVFFLAQLAAAVLVAVTYLSPPVAAWTGLGVVIVAWSIGMGTVRGTAAAAVLTLGLALAARRHAFLHGHAVLVRSVAISIAIQVMMRNDALMTAGPWQAAWTLLVLPVAAALCLVILGRVFGTLGAAVAGAALLTLGPGWTLAGVLTLVVLVFAATVFVGTVFVGTVFTATVSSGTAATRALASNWFRAGLVLAAVLALGVHEPRLAGLALAGGLAVLAHGGGSRLDHKVGRLEVGTILNVSAVLIAVAVAWTNPGADSQAFLRAGMIGALLLPAAAAQAAGLELRGGLVLAGIGALLAVAGAGLTPVALTAGVTVAALALGGSGIAARLQGGWSAGLLTLAVLARAYPWLREAPVERFLDHATSAARASGIPLLGVEVPVLPVFLLVSVASLAGVLERLFRGRLRSEWARASPVVVWGAVAVALLGPLGFAGTVLLAHPTLLTVHRDSWSQRLEPALLATEVVIETNLIQSLALPTGTVLGNVQVLDADQRPLAIWRLELGRDTAEWAALRADIAAQPDFRAPPAWSVAASPAGRHFSARFRNHWTLPTPGKVAWVTVRRNPSLPDDVQLAMYRLEVRP